MVDHQLNYVVVFRLPICLLWQNSRRLNGNKFELKVAGGVDLNLPHPGNS